MATDHLPLRTLPHPHVGEQHPFIDAVAHVAHSPAGFDGRNDGVLGGDVPSDAQFDPGDVHPFERGKPGVQIDRDRTGRANGDEFEPRMNQRAERVLVLGEQRRAPPILQRRNIRR